MIPFYYIARAVAILAPLLGSIQLAPQAFHSIKHQNFRGVSMFSMVSIFIVDLLWAIHGYFIGDISLLLSSAINTLFISVIIFVYMFR